MPANSWRGRVGIIWTEYAANASEMTLRENIPLPRYAHPAMNPRVLWFNSRAQVKAPPSFGYFTPSCAALIPVASAMIPPRTIPMRIPLPALDVADPTATKMPVPMIIAAVIRVAVLRPSVRASEVLDSAFPDCWPDTTSEGVGSLLIFELRSPSSSREKNYRTLERSNTTFFRIDP